MTDINSFISEELSHRFGGDENTVRQLNPLILASVGDAVYTLNIRTHLVATHDYTAHNLHAASASMVCAASQKAAYFRIEPLLTEEEQYIAKRGRNAHPGTIPKNADFSDYRIATALEAVFGYLSILGKNDRIAELMKVILEETHETV